MSTVTRAPHITTLADHGSVEIAVYNIAHGSAENGWGHAYFRAHCDACGWIGHEQGTPNAQASERIGIVHANREPHDPDGANRWIEPDGTVGGYDGSDDT